jgi:biopolymer transport protein ExbB
MTNESTIDAQLLDLMLRAGSRWVLWLMLGLSLAAVAVIAERIWFFVQERPPRELIAKALRTLTQKGPTEALALLKDARSMEAAVARVCLEHASDGPAAVEEHKAAMIEEERMRHEKRIAFLGTLGNNAPFVGLLGTVIGIVQAFHELERAGVNGAANSGIMGAIAEALVATAIGLAVAIPAVAAFNYFQRRIRTTLGKAEALEHILLSLLDGGGSPEPAEAAADETSKPVRLSLAAMPFETAPVVKR